jgi:SAM-dependent methyltransferase
MLNCTTDKYNLLYARWLENSGDLLDLARYQPGMKLLDLCGGTGAVTKEALYRGAHPSSITLFDLNPRVRIRGVREVAGDVHNLSKHDFEPFDIIVCRQAVAYIDLQHEPHALPIGGKFTTAIWNLLKPGGRFVFNSFVRPRWALKSYRYEGHRFFEASGWIPHRLGGGRVGHLQWCRGHGVDVTVFRWHTEPELRAALERFKIDIHRSERGLRWVCTRPSELSPRERFRLAT